MSEDEQTREIDTREKPVVQFEGEYVRHMEGRFPAQTLEMPAGYARGMHLMFHVEARVRGVHYDEASGKDRRGDLVRVHTFAIENVHLADAFSPDERPEDNVGGSLGGAAWRDQLLDYLEGRSDQLDFEEGVIPERLFQLLERGVQPHNLTQAGPEPKAIEAGPEPEEIDEAAGF